MYQSVEIIVNYYIVYIVNMYTMAITIILA